MIDDREEYIRNEWDSGTALFDTDNFIFPVQETCGVWQDVSEFEITHLEVAPDQLQTINSAKHFDPSSSRNMIVTPPSSNQEILGLDSAIGVMSSFNQNSVHSHPVCLINRCQPPAVQQRAQEASSSTLPFDDLRSSYSSSANRYTQPTLLTSRPFICDVTGCSNSYQRIHELRRHKRTHLGVKPYSCRYSQCGKSGLNGFVRKDHLRQHLRQVHRAPL